MPPTVVEFNKQFAHSNTRTIFCNRLTKASEHCKEYDKIRVNLYFSYKCGGTRQAKYHHSTLTSVGRRQRNG